jgi:hypothetical protein
MCTISRRGLATRRLCSGIQSIAARVAVSISVFNPASSEGVQPGLWVNRLERAELGNRHSSARGNKAFSLEVIIQRDDDDEDRDTNVY